MLARKHAAAEVEECKSKFDRVYSVIFEFCAAGREGALRTSLRAHHGGELQPVDSSFWYLERGHRRFDNCRVDPQNPYIVPTGERETKWIYFDRSDFEDLLAPAYRRSFMSSYRDYGRLHRYPETWPRSPT